MRTRGSASPNHSPRNTQRWETRGEEFGLAALPARPRRAEGVLSPTERRASDRRAFLLQKRGAPFIIMAVVGTAFVRFRSLVFLFQSSAPRPRTNRFWGKDARRALRVTPCPLSLIFCGCELRKRLRRSSAISRLFIQPARPTACGCSMCCAARPPMSSFGTTSRFIGRRRIRLIHSSWG